MFVIRIFLVFYSHGVCYPQVPLQTLYITERKFFFSPASKIFDVDDGFRFFFDEFTLLTLKVIVYTHEHRHTYMIGTRIENGHMSAWLDFPISSRCERKRVRESLYFCLYLFVVGALLSVDASIFNIFFHFDPYTQNTHIHKHSGPSTNGT